MQRSNNGSSSYKPTHSPQARTAPSPQTSRPNSGVQVTRRSYNTTYETPKESEEGRPHRRSSQNRESSLQRDYDSGTPSSSPHMSPHLQRHRNSMPILQANTPVQNTDNISETYRSYLPSPAPSSPAQSPVRNSFLASTSTALERQKDVDIQTFTHGRGYAMGHESTRASISRRSPVTEIHDRFVTERRSAREGSRHCEPSGSEDTQWPEKGMFAGNSSRTRPRPCPLNECPPRTGNLVVPASSNPTSPSSPLFKKPGTPTNRPPPPFVPVLDAHRQLACIEALLKHHRKFFNVSGRLINADKLLHEHEVDAQLEQSRCDRERSNGGLSFPERFELAVNNQGKGLCWRKHMAMVDTSEPGYHVFGQKLSLTRMYASCVSSMAGYQQDLPIVVYSCVEELYRTGMTVPGLFRSPPDRKRHSELIEIYDNSSFGRNRSLSKESTADICALLRSYIDRLPHAIWHEALFEPMLKLCIRPTLLHEKVIAEESEKNDTGAKRRPTSLTVLASPMLDVQRAQRMRSGSLNNSLSLSASMSSLALSSSARVDIDLERERPQLAAARALFRLLPRSQLALLAYLCAFFTQLPLCPHNQLSIEDVALLFAVPLFLGKPNGDTACETWAARKEEARTMMVWVLRRWTHISNSLFDIEDDTDDDSEMASDTSSDDSESVYSVLANFDWPEPSGSAKSSPDGPIEPLKALEPLQSIDDFLASRQGAELDIKTWKSHVENDIHELRRALIDVRSRLDK